MTEILEVFADVACPFTHVGLRRIVARRDELGVDEPLLRVRAWPLELVNGQPLDGSALVPKIAALRRHVAPDLFEGFRPQPFVSTTLPALAAEAAAYRTSPMVGEQFSLALRTALFEHGVDVADETELAAIGRDVGAPAPTDADAARVLADYEEGKRRGVRGSPHFFTADGRGIFCPSLEITHEGGSLVVEFDSDGFDELMQAAFA